VHAFTTTRRGGESAGRFSSLNLAMHVGDNEAAVATNRKLLRNACDLPQEPRWLQQEHGVHLVAAEEYTGTPADACYATTPNALCAILTADCLPVLLCDQRATIVVAMHAGWRGLFHGIIRQTLQALALPGAQWLAWLGPAIGANAYAVGADLRAQFVDADPRLAVCFARRDEMWFADLSGIASRQLADAGISRIDRYHGCTAGERQRFFSYRRDGVCGRMASVIWLSR
ncbi:MAG: peptidoglycan editing factor PgeF, partial [Gammaproteobacteria bacterium]